MSDVQESEPRRRGRRPKAAPQRAPQRAPGNGRTRTGRVAFSEDIYAIDRSRLPDHMDYQWVTKSVVGDDTGKVRADLVRFQMNGWEPVEASLLPQYGIEAGEINIGGLVLMQRPMEMTEEARAEDRAKATGQVQTQINRLEGESRDIRKGDEAVSRKPRVFGRGEPISVRSDEDYQSAD